MKANTLCDRARPHYHACPCLRQTHRTISLESVNPLNDAIQQPEPLPEPLAQFPAKPVALPAPRREREPTTDETVKETIESIVIAFILAFVFRAFIVEPFIIPTGSMAPTLLGAHLQMDCPSCGYDFDIGIDPSEVAEGRSLNSTRQAQCPMCNYLVFAGVGTKVRSGDRILVDKFSYHVFEPSRWDVIVFKAPQDEPIGGEPAPRTNFIKRLVALPGERVCLLEGNVFVAPYGTDDFVIARKTDPATNRHWQSIQRSVWQPVYYSQFVPIEDGRSTGPGRDVRHAWRVPWQVTAGQWDLGTDRSPSRVYRFAGGDGEIQFEMAGPYGTTQYDEHRTKYPYNHSSGSMQDRQPIEDIRLACAFSPSTDKATLNLSTTARLDRPDLGIETLTASITTDGVVSLIASPAEGQPRTLAQVSNLPRLKPGIATDVELWLVDDEASVWINDKRVLVRRFDLTWQQIAQRPRQQALPDIRIKLSSDGPVELRRVELDRDLYHFPDRYNAYGFARAEGRRSGEGKIDLGPTPMDLRSASADHDAEMFVLGDNQPASKDSRGWSDVDGWVALRYFDGDDRPGVVPRSLLVGRAFMVYYPAPHGSSPQAKGVFPDFGRVRFIH